MTARVMAGLTILGFLVAFWPGSARVVLADDAKVDVRNRPTTTEMGLSSVAQRIQRRADGYVVEAVLNARGAWPMALDLSSPYTIIDDDIASTLELKTTRTIMWSAGPGQKAEPAGVATLRSLGIGSVGFLDFDVLVVDLDATAGGRRQYHGIIGRELLTDFTLMLDFEGQRLTLRKGALGPADGKEVFDCRREDGLWAVPVTVADETLDVVIETRRRGGLVLPNAMAVKVKVKPRLAELQGADGLITDLDVGAVAAEDAIKLGRFELRATPVSFDANQARVGLEVLRHFVVSVDARNGRVGMTRLLDEPVTFPVESRYGFVFVRTGDALTVLHVLPGSIADRSVIGEGDRITRVLGIPVTQYRDEQITSILKEKDTLHLTVDRGGFPLLVPLNAQ